MGRKFEIWLDSGANIHSCKKQVLDLEDDLGISSDAWDEMSEKERDNVMREVAWETLDWGYAETD